jgi:hypothetical protein
MFAFIGGFIVGGLALYFIGVNRGKAAVSVEKAKLEALHKELDAALAKGTAWA